MKQKLEYFSLQLIFRILKLTCISSASQPASLPDPVPLGVGLQKFHMKKVMAADLRKHCSEDDLSTEPWQFLLSFVPAFTVFRTLFAITQLLCHVSALLISACKQA